MQHLLITFKKVVRDTITSIPFLVFFITTVTIQEQLQLTATDRTRFGITIKGGVNNIIDIWEVFANTTYFLFSLVGRGLILPMAENLAVELNYIDLTWL